MDEEYATHLLFQESDCPETVRVEEGSELGREPEKAAQGDNIASTSTGDRSTVFSSDLSDCTNHTNHTPSILKNKYFKTSHWHFKRNGTKTFHGYITVHQ